MRFCRSGREGFLAFCPVPKILIFGLVKSRENMCPSLDEKSSQLFNNFGIWIRNWKTDHTASWHKSDARGMPSPMPSEPWYQSGQNRGKICWIKLGSKVDSMVSLGNTTSACVVRSAQPRSATTRLNECGRKSRWKPRCNPDRNLAHLSVVCILCRMLVFRTSVYSNLYKLLSVCSWSQPNPFGTIVAVLQSFLQK